MHFESFSVFVGSCVSNQASQPDCTLAPGFSHQSLTFHIAFTIIDEESVSLTFAILVAHEPNPFERAIDFKLASQLRFRDFVR